MARLNLAIWQLLVTPFKHELRDPSIRRACVWILSFHFAAPGSISEWNFSTSFLSLFVYKKKTLIDFYRFPVKEIDTPRLSVGGGFKKWGSFVSFESFNGGVRGLLLHAGCAFYSSILVSYFMALV